MGTTIQQMLPGVSMGEADISCVCCPSLCLTLLLSMADVLEQPTLPAAEGLCHCDTCGRRHVWDGAREGRGFCSEHCHQQFKER